MTDLIFAKATKSDLWNEIKRLEGEGAPEETEEMCDGACCPAAQHTLVKVHAWPWRLRSEGKPGLVDIIYCPFCGRELADV